MESCKTSFVHRGLDLDSLGPFQKILHDGTSWKKGFETLLFLVSSQGLMVRIQSTRAKEEKWLVVPTMSLYLGLINLRGT